MNKTQKEIDTEVEKLKEMKPRVLKRSAFGDDHHAAIDAQIEVLERGLSSNDVYDWDDEGLEDDERPAENVMDSAQDAVRWRDGENDEEAPSRGWDSLIR